MHKILFFFVILFLTSCGSYYSTSNDNYYPSSGYYGKPKDVHVRGYYRSNGTYVQPHYRSRPTRSR